MIDKLRKLSNSWSASRGSIAGNLSEAASTEVPVSINQPISNASNSDSLSSSPNDTLIDHVDTRFDISSYEDFYPLMANYLHRFKSQIKDQSANIKPRHLLRIQKKLAQLDKTIDKTSRVAPSIRNLRDIFFSMNQLSKSMPSEWYWHKETQHMLALEISNQIYEIGMRDVKAQIEKDLFRTHCSPDDSIEYQVNGEGRGSYGLFVGGAGFHSGKDRRRSDTAGMLIYKKYGAEMILGAGDAGTAHAGFKLGARKFNMQGYDGFHNFATVLARSKIDSYLRTHARGVFPFYSVAKSRENAFINHTELLKRLTLCGARYEHDHFELPPTKADNRYDVNARRYAGSAFLRVFTGEGTSKREEAVGEAVKFECVMSSLKSNNGLIFSDRVRAVLKKGSIWKKLFNSQSEPFGDALAIDQYIDQLEARQTSPNKAVKQTALNELAALRSQLIKATRSQHAELLSYYEVVNQHARRRKEQTQSQASRKIVANLKRIKKNLEYGVGARRPAEYVRFMATHHAKLTKLIDRTLRQVQQDLNEKQEQELSDYRHSLVEIEKDYIEPKIYISEEDYKQYLQVTRVKSVDYTHVTHEVRIADRSLFPVDLGVKVTLKDNRHMGVPDYQGQYTCIEIDGGAGLPVLASPLTNLASQASIIITSQLQEFLSRHYREGSQGIAEGIKDSFLQLNKVNVANSVGFKLKIYFKTKNFEDDGTHHRYMYSRILRQTGLSFGHSARGVGFFMNGGWIQKYTRNIFTHYGTDSTAFLERKTSEARFWKDPTRFELFTENHKQVVKSILQNMAKRGSGAEDDYRDLKNRLIQYLPTAGLSASAILDAQQKMTASDEALAQFAAHPENDELYQTAHDAVRDLFFLHYDMPYTRVKEDPYKHVF